MFVYTILYVPLFGVICTGMKRNRFKIRTNVMDFKLFIAIF